MLQSMEDYIGVVGSDVVASIYKKASKLVDKHIVNINSTFQGGGVAEILSRLVPMMNFVGVNTGWRILHGNPAFFEVTKKFHNALQGAEINLSPMKKKLYLDVNEEFSVYTHLDHDGVILHDPQPLPLIKFCHKKQPWIWRCHIDLSNPNKELWSFLREFVLMYDLVIFSSEDYKKNDLSVKQKIVHPAIDPLSLKNRELSKEVIVKYITKAGIPTDKPVVSQVSRMDPWKDPEGVLDVFDLVKKKVDCRLLFCYNLATDDPEGMEIYSRVYKKAEYLVKRRDAIFVVGNNDILVNSIQRFSDVIIQKSTKEGFSLTVTEALWKGKPVVGSRVGGIPDQIKDGENGFLVDPYDITGCADRVIELLKNPKLCEEMGKKAKEGVRQNFLTTRLMSDYLDILLELLT